LKKKNYKIIEHTADIGIIVDAPDSVGIFVKAAEAMFDIMAERRDANAPDTSGIKLDVRLTAENQDELLVNWLNELLSLSSARGLIFTEYKIHKLTEHSLDASVSAEDKKYYRQNVEFKAATYHELELVHGPDSYKAKVIFDV
jgi:SHS2 domain-containing protein